MTNIFYFNYINRIGGTEQFLYEIVKKYHDYDITIFYDEADGRQLARLKKYVSCKKYIRGQKYKCKKAFFNFNLGMIDDVEAEEYYFVSHANYEELHRVHGGNIPPIDNPKITKMIGVSDFASKKINEYAEKIGIALRAETCYNPLTLEPKQDVPILVSACRLNDAVKGGSRTLRLIEALDKYCTENNRNYLWLLFTNNTNIRLHSPNVVYMKPRIDVRPYISMASWVLQLSNDMETYCYTINEALSYGVPIVTTPLSILKELPIKQNEHIELDWNCSNVDNVARQIFEKKVKKFEYKAPEDRWNEILVKGKNEYIYNKDEIVDVKCVRKYYDKEFKTLFQRNSKFRTDLERAEYLSDLGLIKII